MKLNSNNNQNEKAAAVSNSGIFQTKLGFLKRGLGALVLTTALLSGGAAWAKVPQVVVSIKPLHSLVSAVMQDVGEPELIVKGAGSEHGYALKPDDARLLSKADIVFWAGPEMEVFMQKSLETLAGKAEIVALAHSSNITLIPMRQGGMFEAHKHHNEEGKSDGHMDLHFWLDPQNAIASLGVIADILAEKDPGNSERYHANAKAYAQRLDALTDKIKKELEPVRGRPFIVFHDAYHYFEKRFAITAAGSITVSPEQAPGARRIGEVRDKVKSFGQVCIFSEPQFEPRLVETIRAGTEAKTGVLDPLGFDITEGPDQYPQMIENLAGSLKACLESLE